jgi:hypothetical protein
MVRVGDDPACLGPAGECVLVAFRDAASAHGAPRVALHRAPLGDAVGAEYVAARQGELQVDRLRLLTRRH